MKKRQKLILILYINAVTIMSFLYVPYIRHFTDGSKRYIGHHLRFKLWELTPWQTKYVGHITIDANLIVAELFAITAITVVMFMFFKRDQ